MKRKLLLLLTVLLLNTAFMAGAQEYTITTENISDGSIRVTFDLQVAPVLETVEQSGQNFSYFTNLTEFLKSTEMGYPEYLSKQVPLLIEQDIDYTLEVLESDYREYDLPHNYLVGRGTITRNMDPASIPYTVIRSAVTDAYYPESIVEMKEYYIIRNVRGFNFRFNITQFNTAEKKARVYTHLEFLLNPKSASEGATNALSDVEEVRSVTSEVYQAMPQLFSNYSTQTRSSWNYELGDKGEIFVIYTARDEEAIKPYIDHKKSKGFTVTAKKVTKGTNVKSEIQNAYNANKNILYVQLVGDWADIKSDTMSDGAPTDTFLGAVSGNDNYIDLIVGRFSAETPEQVTVQVNKVIDYETNQIKSGADWLGRAIGIASDEGAGSGDDKEADYQHMDVIKENKLLPNQYTDVKEFYKSVTSSEVGTAINDGVQVINYVGHGSDTSWVTSGFSSSDVNNLANEEKLPIIFSVACVNGTFHKSATCFAETWLRKEGGGAVATVMSTINQPWTPPMRGQDYMNDLLTGGYDYSSNPGSGTSTDHGKETFGSIVFNAFSLMYSESSTTQDLQTIKTWTIFGDASLRVIPDKESFTVNFTYKMDGTDRMKYHFTDTSESTDSTITEREWDFGDKTTSKEVNPVHTYTEDGIYTVTLTAHTEAGESKTLRKDIKVEKIVYKSSGSNNSSYEWIAKVKVDTFENESQGASYTDFTSKNIELTKETDYSIALTPDFKPGSSYTENWTVWIDLNKDGDFEDSGEKVFSGSGKEMVEGTINIPAGAITGSTRMRIVMSYSKDTASEGAYSYGETEDYTVTISE